MPRGFYGRGRGFGGGRARYGQPVPGVPFLPVASPWVVAVRRLAV